MVAKIVCHCAMAVHSSKISDLDVAIRWSHWGAALYLCKILLHDNQKSNYAVKFKYQVSLHLSMLGLYPATIRPHTALSCSHWLAGNQHHKHI